MLPPDVKVFPGHGQFLNLDEVREYTTMRRRNDCRRGSRLKQGSTLDQMKKDKILAAWDKKYANKFVTQHIFIETLYN